MQKRYQVLIPDWLEEYIKWGVERYGLSFSELIRLEICQAVISTICARYPEYNPGYTTQDLLEDIGRSEKGDMSPEDMDRATSKIYFEARKAIEYRFAKEKLKKKKDS